MLRAPQAAVLVVLFFLAACGSGPTDSPDGSESIDPLEGGRFTDDNTYINEIWGFRISPPNRTWSARVEIYEQTIAPNGVPLLEMFFVSPSASPSTGFLPVLYLAPNALTEDKTLDEVIASTESDLLQLFGDYAPATKQTVLVGTKNAAQWEFQATASEFNFMPGTQFRATLVLHGREVYLMIGNGFSDYFPTDDYQKIVDSFELTD